MKPSILLIYTGGTIGMKKDPETGHLKPFDFAQISEEVPELAKFGYPIESRSFNPIIDSSDVRPEFWVKLAEMIRIATTPISVIWEVISASASDSKMDIS